MVTFEQPKELNRLIFPYDRWSWARIWTGIRLSAPLAALFAVLMTEARYFQGLPLWSTLFVTPVLWLFCAFMVRVSIQWEARRERRLEIADSGIRTYPCAYIPPRIRWRRIKCFIVEPAGSSSECKLLTVQFRRHRWATPRRWWMILADSRQCESLIAELKQHQALQVGGFTIEIFHRPFRIEGAASIPTMAFWLLALGLLFFYHGIPMMMLPLAPSEHHETNPAPLSPQAIHLLSWWTGHFSTVKEFIYGTTIVGAVFTAAGVICWFIASRLLPRKKTDEVMGDERILPPSENPGGAI